MRRNFAAGNAGYLHRKRGHTVSMRLHDSQSFDWTQRLTEPLDLMLSAYQIGFHILLAEHLDRGVESRQRQLINRSDVAVTRMRR